MNYQENIMKLHVGKSLIITFQLWFKEVASP